MEKEPRHQSGEEESDLLQPLSEIERKFNAGRPVAFVELPRQARADNFEHLIRLEDDNYLRQKLNEEQDAGHYCEYGHLLLSSNLSPYSQDLHLIIWEMDSRRSKPASGFEDLDPERRSELVTFCYSALDYLRQEHPGKHFVIGANRGETKLPPINTDPELSTRLRSEGRRFTAMPIQSVQRFHAHLYALPPESEYHPLSEQAQRLPETDPRQQFLVRQTFSPADIQAADETVGRVASEITRRLSASDFTADLLQYLPILQNGCLELTLDSNPSVAAQQIALVTSNAEVTRLSLNTGLEDACWGYAWSLAVDNNGQHQFKLAFSDKGRGSAELNGIVLYRNPRSDSSETRGIMRRSLQIGRKIIKQVVKQAGGWEELPEH